jgi:hypothetical protein
MDDTVQSSSDQPPDYAIGWDIPERYNVGGGGWTTIQNLQHRVDIDANGKKTIQKADVGPFSKNVDDVSSGY